jgi:hypothetical protein
MTTADQVLVQDEQADTPGTSHGSPGISNRITVSWDAVINFLVPVGYEDESGFHYGGPPVPHGVAGVNFNSRGDH